MFIGRRPDGTIYGAWTCAQPQDADHPGVEEVADDHPDLVAFLEATKLPDLKAEVAGEERTRAAQFEELERKMSLGAPQAEINRAILDLIKE